MREERVNGVPGVPDMLPSNGWEPSVGPFTLDF